MRINREDMLELTRRMTAARTSMTRIAGSYMDADGEIEGTFNTNFLNLSTGEKEKNLAIAKTIPFSRTNENLRRYRIPDTAMKAGSDAWSQTENGVETSIIGPIRCCRNHITDGTESHEEEIHGKTCPYQQAGFLITPHFTNDIIDNVAHWEYNEPTGQEQNLSAW